MSNCKLSPPCTKPKLVCKEFEIRLFSIFIFDYHQTIVLWEKRSAKRQRNALQSGVCKRSAVCRQHLQNEERKRWTKYLRIVIKRVFDYLTLSLYFLSLKSPQNLNPNSIPQQSLHKASKTKHKSYTRYGQNFFVHIPNFKFKDFSPNILTQF
ncbi:hypothetical protein Hanom_Chr00s002160g01692791 [Helianthus anomalus]